MKIELGQYRFAHLSGDEICVLGAFLKLPCLYGISAGWMRRGYLRMEDRVLRTAAALEQRGVLLMEPGGMVRMEETLYRLVMEMGHATHLGRVAYACGREQGRIYLYHSASGLVTAEWDQRGNYFLGRVDAREKLAEALEEVEGQEDARERPGDGWLGAIVMEKKESFWERTFDLAWTREEGLLTKAWEEMCHRLVPVSAGADKKGQAEKKENIDRYVQKHTRG